MKLDPRFLEQINVLLLLPLQQGGKLVAGGKSKNPLTVSDLIAVIVPIISSIHTSANNAA